MTQSNPSSLHFLLSYDDKLGGAIHAALNTCKFLAQFGETVEALAPVYPNDDLSQLAGLYSGFTTNRLRGSAAKGCWNARDVEGWLRENHHRFDIVEVHCVWSLAAVKVMRTCIKLQKPYLLRSHGSLDPFDLAKRSLLKRVLGPLVLKKLFGHAAGIVCTAELEADRLVTYGANPQTFVLPLPVPLSNVKTDRNGFRIQHHIPADAQVVLFMSRIDYKKGLEFLIPALAKLKEVNTKLWFVMAGSGTAHYSSQIGKMIEHFGIRSWTTQLGYVTGQDKQNAFAAADIFALPSLNENFGIVNIEAMHAKLPLLISDEVYIHKEIGNAGAGVICQPSIDSVFISLQKMLGDKSRLDAMGQRGHELVQRQYLPKAATQELVSLYRHVLAER